MDLNSMILGCNAPARRWTVTCPLGYKLHAGLNGALSIMRLTVVGIVKNASFIVGCNRNRERECNL